MRRERWTLARRLLSVAIAGAGIGLLASCSGDGGTFSGAGSLDLTVMTFNVMFDFPKEGFDAWSVRKETAAEIILRQDPDLIGFQEPLPWQVDSLHELLPGYADARLQLNTDSTIFFRESRFELVDEGSFWLSPTPDREFSIGFGNTFPRMVMWVRLHDRESGRDFFFVTTHFDNTSPFQENAAPLYLERTEPMAASLPIVHTGDYNSEPDTEAYGILTGGVPYRLVNAFDLAGRYQVIQSPGDTRTYAPASRIDHVFLAGGDWTVSRWVVDMTTYGDPPKDPSDHFAITTDVHLRGGG